MTLKDLLLERRSVNRDIDIDDADKLTFYYDNYTLELSRDGSEWIESGDDVPDSWGSESYQSYLDLRDLLSWISRDYGDELGRLHSIEIDGVDSTEIN